MIKCIRMRRNAIHPTTYGGGRTGILLIVAMVGAALTGWGCEVISCLAVDAAIDQIAREDVVTSDPGALSFEIVEGGAAATQQLEVNCFFDPDACLDEPSTYSEEECVASISTSQTWMSSNLSEYEGTADIDVTVDPAGLAPGTYEGSLHLERRDWDWGTDELEVPITLVVTPAPQADEGP